MTPEQRFRLEFYHLLELNLPKPPFILILYHLLEYHLPK